MRGLLSLILNVIWLLFGGIWLFLLYTLAAILCFVLIVTIPFGFASFRIARFALWPFGRTVVKKPTAGAASKVGNFLWLLLFGWWLVLGHIITGVLQCLTIYGIPLGLANFKLIKVSLFPLGREIVPVVGARSGEIQIEP